MEQKLSADQRRNLALDKKRLAFLLEHVAELADPKSEASRLLTEGVALITDSLSCRHVSDRENIFDYFVYIFGGSGVVMSDPWEKIYQRVADFVKPYQEKRDQFRKKELEYLALEIERLSRPVLCIGEGI